MEVSYGPLHFHCVRIVKRIIHVFLEMFRLIYFDGVRTNV